MQQAGNHRLDHIESQQSVTEWPPHMIQHSLRSRLPTVIQQPLSDLLPDSGLGTPCLGPLGRPDKTPNQASTSRTWANMYKGNQPLAQRRHRSLTLNILPVHLDRKSAHLSGNGRTRNHLGSNFNSTIHPSLNPILMPTGCLPVKTPQ